MVFSVSMLVGISDGFVDCSIYHSKYLCLAERNCDVYEYGVLAFGAIGIAPIYPLNIQQPEFTASIGIYSVSLSISILPLAISFLAISDTKSFFLSE